MATARRVVYGEVTELDEGQLWMTPSEATLVLEHLGRTSERIEKETWPALVGLVASASTDWRQDGELDSTLFRFFAEEILNQASPAQQRFMLMSAIPVYLNPSLIRVLPIRREGRASIMLDLQDRGLLRPDRKGNLSFHPLLRDFLVGRARERDPQVVERVGREVVAAYTQSGDWDAAFDVATMLQLPDLMATVMRNGSQALFKSGRLETIEGWLTAVEDADEPSAESLLMRAEISLQRGAFTRSAALARYALTLLDESESQRAAAWNLLGRALHMRCDYLGALEAYERAWESASNSEDRWQAAWGRLITTVELGRDDPSSFATDLETIASRTVDHRLRIACGRMMAAERGGKRLPLTRYREALALIDLAEDPMAISHAYAMGIFTQARRAAYREALALAGPAISYCTDLHLTFPSAYCLAYRANAELGCRQLRAARATLVEVARHLDSIEDAHLALVYEALRVKLAIAAGGTSSSLLDSSLRFAAGDVPDWALADLLGVEALGLAARGEPDRVHEREERLKHLNSGPTAYVSITLAHVIAEAYGAGRSRELVVTAGESARLAIRLQCLDSFVTAYRAWPPLLELALADPGLARVIRATLTASDDWRLAEGTSIAPRAGPGSALSSLTRRETEVAALIAAGLTNVEISKQLYIAHSTAKVHVRNVLRKLNARTRLEAALVWRDAQPDVRQQ